MWSCPGTHFRVTGISPLQHSSDEKNYRLFWTAMVRAIDLRYLQRWSESRKKPALRNMGVDEIHLGKKQKFSPVVSNLDAAEPLWFGQDRKKDTLDEFF